MITRCSMMRVGVTLVVLSSMSTSRGTGGESIRSRGPMESSPFERQISRERAHLESSSWSRRAGGAEALGYLRAYGAAALLVKALRDESPDVRREAALSLAWCGGRATVAPLLRALDDSDWAVRQTACVSLMNLTGMEIPFDALAATEARRAAVLAWRKWWSSVVDAVPPSEVLALARAKDLESRLRGVRALGALGGEGASETVREVLLGVLQRDERQLDPLEKHLAQSCVRSLGRLRDPASLPLLIDLLETAYWARYASDALGDFGAHAAVKPLVAAYPLFSRHLDDPYRRPELCPIDDRFSGDNTQDRMFETPYAIAQALVRLAPFDDDERAALRDIAPFILANLPSDWDGGMLYEQEAFELVTADLLERAGLRQAALDAAFQAAARSTQWFEEEPERITAALSRGLTPEACFSRLAMKTQGDVPYMASWLPALCRDARDVPRLIGLLEHENGWVRINAAKALMFMGARSAVEPIAKLLAASRPAAEYGFSGVLEHDEYNDPAPRWREAYVRALGRLGAGEHDRQLVAILEDSRNVLDLQHAAAVALDELGTGPALKALGRAEAGHPFYSIRLIAREALWRRDLLPKAHAPAHALSLNTSTVDSPIDKHLGSPEASAQTFVFIKGENRMRSDFNAQSGVDPWRQTYTVNNSGPTMREGRNLHVVTVAPDGATVVHSLTDFEAGYVADCEVSWDGTRVIFARRRNDDHRNYRDAIGEKPRLREPAEYELDGEHDPWWHIWEVNVDGTGLRQITRGPYHDVQPAYLPDGRVVFCSTRLGLRDEYHGFLSTGLTVMNGDGSDLHVIGLNLGGDREPAVMPDGRIVFSRLDVFYSRFKSELTLQAVNPDGTRNVVLYGPERRAYWMGVHRESAAWTMRSAYGGGSDNRNRVLRLSQPQPYGDGRVVCATSGGLVLVGPGSVRETLIPHDRKWAVTSPFPLGDGTLLCAATVKQFLVDGRIVTGGTREFRKLRKGPSLFRSATNIDLGLYRMDVESGKMDLLYNDPGAADFEARPIAARRRPRSVAESPRTRMGSYTARLFCSSALNSRHARVRSRGKLVRVIEGQAVVSRHETQSSQRASQTNRWKNHAGTHARVLGTFPLAADGSFHVELPADRLLQLQVLDSDRRVLANQTFWMYARPGETRSCGGCHQKPDTVLAPTQPAQALKVDPLKALPTGGEFTYRAKMWLKGVLPDEAEERTRTVRAVSLIGRN